jgi:hypothetical protein
MFLKNVQFLKKFTVCMCGAVVSGNLTAIGQKSKSSQFVKCYQQDSSATALTVFLAS